MTLILSTALAGIVGDVSDPVQFELNGTFNRVFPDDEGDWSVALGAGRGLKMQAVDRDLQALGQFEDVISGTEFIDIAITPCPDGGWLVAGSAAAGPAGWAGGCQQVRSHRPTWGICAGGRVNVRLGWWHQIGLVDGPEFRAGKRELLGMI